MTYSYINFPCTGIVGNHDIPIRFRLCVRFSLSKSAKDYNSSSKYWLSLIEIWFRIFVDAHHSSFCHQFRLCCDNILNPVTCFQPLFVLIWKSVLYSASIYQHVLTALSVDCGLSSTQLARYSVIVSGIDLLVNFFMIETPDMMYFQINCRPTTVYCTPVFLPNSAWAEGDLDVRWKIKCF